MSIQPDFVEQKSSIEETVKAAGHLSLFLPKFHCELNIIEYFWGQAKRWTREHCDFTFEGMKRELPLGLKSVSTELIRKWECRMKRWIDAYEKGLDVESADKEVRALSLHAKKRFASHRATVPGLD
jgi:hypothetical protein